MFRRKPPRPSALEVVSALADMGPTKASHLDPESDYGRTVLRSLELVNPVELNKNIYAAGPASLQNIYENTLANGNVYLLRWLNRWRQNESFSMGYLPGRVQVGLEQVLINEAAALHARIDSGAMTPRQQAQALAMMEMAENLGINYPHAIAALNTRSL